MELVKMENKDGEKMVDGFDEEHFEPPMEVKKLEKLTLLLSSLQPGWKVAILRQQPSWCKGHLETIEIYDPGEEGSQVDINYLIKEWGGTMLYLKIHDERGKWVGGGGVSLFSYPPRVHGKLLQEPNYTELVTPQPNPSWPYPYPPQPGAPAPTFDFGKLLDIVLRQKNTDPTMLLKVIELQQAQQQQAVQQPQNPLDQMIGMMSLFREMKGMFGDVFGGGGGGGGDESNGMIPMIAEVVKGLMAKQAQPTSRRVLAPPHASANASANMAGPSGTQPLPSPQSVDTLGSLAEKIARLSPGDAAEVVLQALGNMAEPERSKAMTIFLAQMGEEAEEDEKEALDDEEGDVYSKNQDGPIFSHPGIPSRTSRK